MRELVLFLQRVHRCFKLQMRPGWSLERITGVPSSLQQTTPPEMVINGSNNSFLLKFSCILFSLKMIIIHLNAATSEQINEEFHFSDKFYSSSESQLSG